jgi:rare lipoprotein A
MNILEGKNMIKHIIAFIMLCIAHILPDSAWALPVSKNDVNSARQAYRSETGVASYYGDRFHGRQTANGERYDQGKFTAAHKSYPFGTLVRATNLKNGKSVIVRINDRGPYVKGRIIDLSVRAAETIDLLDPGITKIKLEILKYGQ